MSPPRHLARFIVQLNMETDASTSGQHQPAVETFTLPLEGRVPGALSSIVLLSDVRFNKDAATGSALNTERQALPQFRVATDKNIVAATAREQWQKEMRSAVHSDIE